jgi:hypothetical protein
MTNWTRNAPLFLRLNLVSRHTPFAVFVLLFLLAISSFLTSEITTAGVLGFPTDAIWQQVSAARDLSAGKGIGRHLAIMRESPLAVVLASLVGIATHFDAALTVLATKAISLLAVCIAAWALMRFLAPVGAASSMTGVGAALVMSVSPLYVWLGASGSISAVGVGAIALALVWHYEDKPAPTALALAFASLSAPAAAPLLMFYPAAARRHRWWCVAIASLTLSAYAIVWIASSGNSVTGPQSAVSALVSQWFKGVSGFFMLVGGPVEGATHPVLLGVGAIAGAWVARRTYPMLVAAALLPAVCVGVLPIAPAKIGEQLAVSLPAVFALALFGFRHVTSMVPTEKVTAGRIGMGILALYLVFSAPLLSKMRTLSAWQVENTALTGREGGNWLAEHSQPGESIATTAPGVIAFFSRRDVVDLNSGLASAPGTELAGISWVAINVSEAVPEVLERGYRLEKTVRFRVNAGVFPRGDLLIYRKATTPGLAQGWPIERDMSTISNKLREFSEESAWYSECMTENPSNRNPNSVSPLRRAVASQYR